MNRITITEQDLTTNSTGYRFSDTVFIPGFSNGGSAETGVPVRCESLADFNNYFGSMPPIFDADQLYPKYEKGSKSGFTTNAALPEATDSALPIMYPKYSTDLSWILARRYLSAGLPVVYVRMNSKFYSTINETGNYAFPGEYQNASGQPVEIIDTTGLGTNNDCYILKSSNTRVREEEALNAEGGIKSGYEKLTFKSSYDVTVANAYKFMEESIFNGESIIYDKGEYDVKFITSGGYPTFEYRSASDFAIDDMMLGLAASRGDCVAFIDHTNNSSRPLGRTDENSVYYAIQHGADGMNIANLTYGSMFTPWVELSGNLQIPGTAVYIEAFAKNSIYNPSWLAVAGVQRGSVSIKRLCTDTPLTNTIADDYQRLGSSDDTGISINAITYINGYGYCIWGNRTLTNRVANGAGFATSTLNIRNLVSDVKKQVRLAAISCMFEQNNNVLWINFKSLISPLLDRMVSGYGLKNYKIIKNQVADKSKLSANIILYPENTVESFEITIMLTDEDAEISE